MKSKSTTNSHLVRLNKYISECGVCSRRKADLMIEDGHVKINGYVQRELGIKIDPRVDVVEVQGNVIDSMTVTKLYMVLNKPRGYMTTMNDPEGRKCVADLTKGLKTRVFPVGRLDYLSEGLLIMTNDGDLANEIIHPRYEIEKVYEVKVFGIVKEDLLKNLRKGVKSSVGFLKPKNVRLIKHLDNKTWLEFRLIEGKNREIRRICEAFGIQIDKLRRVAIGGLSISGIAPGNFNMFTKEQIVRLVGMNSKKVHKDAHYFSPKKSVSKNKIKQAKGENPLNPEYGRFTRENYKKFMNEKRLTKIALEKQLAEEQKQEPKIY